MSKSVLSIPAAQFQDRVRDCVDSASPRFALSELNSLLANLTAGELRDAIATPPPPGLSHFLGNYIAAMVEYACAHGVRLQFLNGRAPSHH
jgi:hypothetical protein